MNKISSVVIVFIFSIVLIGYTQDEPAIKANRIAWSPDGRYLVVNTIRSLWLYDLEAPEAPYRLDGGDESYLFKVVYLQFDPNSQYLAYGSGPYLNVVNLRDKSQILSVSGEDNVLIDYHGFKFSQDGKFIYTIGLNRESHAVLLNIWVLTGSQNHYTHYIGDAIPEFGGLSSDFSVLAILPYDFSVDRDPTNDPESNLLLYEFDVVYGIGDLIGDLPFSGNIYTSQFSPDGGYYVLSWLDGRVNVISTQTGQVIREIQIQEPICGDWGIRFSFSPDNLLLAIVNICVGSQQLIWTFNESDVVYQTMFNNVGYSFFSEDGHRLIGVDSTDTEGMIYIWNIDDNFKVTQYSGQQPELHTNEDLMATIGQDGNVWIWDIELEQVQMILPVPHN